MKTMVAGESATMSQIPMMLRFSWHAQLPGEVYRELIQWVNDITAERPLTLTDIWQQMVTAGILDGNRRGYKKASRFLVRARAHGDIDSSRIRQGRGRFGRRWGGYPPPKFQVGDKVTLRIEHCPHWMREGLRASTPRTVVTTGRLPGVPASEYISYFLGCNRMGNDVSYYPFRSFQLVPWKSKGSRGRPRAKRAYVRQNGHHHAEVPDSTNYGLLVDSVPSPGISCANERVLEGVG